MKDIIITPKRAKTELLYLLFSFVVAIGLNVYSIVTYNTGWGELFSMWYIVLPLSVGFYIALAVIRCIVCNIINLIKK